MQEPHWGISYTCGKKHKQSTPCEWLTVTQAYEEDDAALKMTVMETYNKKIIKEKRHKMVFCEDDTRCMFASK